jgi:hypothetical protein
MQFGEQLQITNSGLRYVYITLAMWGQGSCSSSRYLEECPHKGFSGPIGGILLIAQGSSLATVSGYPSDDNVDTGRPG